MKFLGLVLSLGAYLSCTEARHQVPEPPSPIETSPASPLAEGAEFDQEHRRWTKLLAEHVQGDAVDYVGLKGRRAELQAYLDELAAVTPAQLASWTRDERFAYWINTYNAFCIQLVVDNYPVDSIRDLGGKLFGRVWDKEYIPLAAHHPDGDDDPLSLNDVEHEILRPRFADARLHAAVNCASVSCPPLRPEAFVAERLDAQLGEQMRGFLADDARNRFDRDAREANVSEIFDWFAADFERDAGSVRAYLARFAPGDGSWIREADLDYLDYDWSLNDTAN